MAVAQSCSAGEPQCSTRVVPRPCFAHQDRLVFCIGQRVNSRTAQVLVLITSTTVLLACGSSASTSVTAPTGTRCQATVNTPATSFPPAGGSSTIAVAVSRDCSWTATSRVPWITFTSEPIGQGDGSISYRVLENAEPVQRQGMINVAERQLPIAQQPAACTFGFSGMPPSVSSAGTE